MITTTAMKTGKILMALPILVSLYSCQSEAPRESVSVGRIFTARATLPDSNNTRTHITYGNTDIDKEEFRWHEITDVYDDNDFISIFNVTRFSEHPYSVELNAVEVNGNTAIFESADSIDNTFNIRSGDLLFVNYYDTETKRTSDGQDVFTLYVGTERNAPQYILPNPADSMSYMQGNLKMYDIVTAVEDNKIPDIHFKHLSAIMRITLHNETGKDLYPTQLEFIYPTTSPTALEGEIINLEGDTINRNPSFFATTLYCSVEINDNNEPYLKVCDSEFYTNKSKPYTEKISTTINGKDGTTDAGESIKNGESYELYLSTVPRIGNDSYGKEFTINLIQNHKTETPYSITIDNFNTVIQAGKRYWFNLVATPDNKLVFKSQYNPDDYKTNGSSGEENKEENGVDSTPKD